MNAPVARRCYVSGRVQGVSYRAATQHKAHALCCTGYARNLEDGRVEVLIVGEAASVQALIDWLWQGSPTAQVKSVDVREVQLAELGPTPSEFATD